MQSLNPNDEARFWSRLEVYLFSLIDAVKKYPTLDSAAISILQMYLELAGKPEPIPICVRRSFLKVFCSLASSPHKDPEFMYRVMCATLSCFD